MFLPEEAASYSTDVLMARKFALKVTVRRFFKTTWIVFEQPLPATGDSPALLDRWQRPFELFVDFHLISCDHFIGFVGHADDGL